MKLKELNKFYRLFYPKLIFLLLTWHKDFYVTPIKWHTPLSKKLLFGFVLEKSSKVYKILEKTKEFTLNLFEYKYKEEVKKAFLENIKILNLNIDKKENYYYFKESIVTIYSIIEDKTEFDEEVFYVARAITINIKQNKFNETYQNTNLILYLGNNKFQRF